MNKMLPALIAEVIGTFALCFAGIMAIHQFGGVPAGLIGIAMAHGLALATMISAIGYLSGGHFNPAVTVGILILGKIKPGMAVAYIVAQMLGGVLAGLAVVAISTNNPMAVLTGGIPAIGMTAAAPVAGAVATTAPLMVPVVSQQSATHAEMIATFFLVLAVCASAVDPRGNRTMAGFIIGLTVAMDILAIGPWTGAAMNPARAFGPALAAMFYGAPKEWTDSWWQNSWTYAFGPFVGGAIAALVYRFLLAPKAGAASA